MRALILIIYMVEWSPVPLDKELEVPSPTPVNCTGICDCLRGLGFFFFFSLRASLTCLTDYNCQRRENAEHPCLMPDGKGHSSSSILHWATSTLNGDGGRGGWWLSSPPPPLFSTPFLPSEETEGLILFSQVETISSLIALSFCLSLSDGQAAWAVMEGSETGQRWLSGIILLWNPPPQLK